MLTFTWLANPEIVGVEQKQKPKCFTTLDMPTNHLHEMTSPSPGTPNLQIPTSGSSWHCVTMLNMSPFVSSRPTRTIIDEIPLTAHLNVQCMSLHDAWQHLPHGAASNEKDQRHIPDNPHLQMHVDPMLTDYFKARTQQHNLPGHIRCQRVARHSLADQPETTCPREIPQRRHRELMP